MRALIVAPAGAVGYLSERFGPVVVAEVGSGLYRAINGGLRSDQHWTYAGYLNDDDVLLPGFAQLLASLAETEGIDVAYGNVVYLDSQGKDLGRLPIARPADVGAVLAAGRAAFTQQGVLFGRSIWTRLGGFDERWKLAADYDFWCRAVRSNARFLRVPSTVAGFRLHAEQLSGNRMEMQEELSQVCACSRPTIAATEFWVRMLRFRLDSLGVVLRRRIRAGVWTSAQLYRRYSGWP